MIATSKINMDLASPGVTPTVHAVQDDRYSRNLELLLHEGRTPWQVPKNAGALCRYRKPDGTCGEYDTMPDGSAAWFAAGNAVTVKLAPQVLTVPGTVHFMVTLTEGETELSAFGLKIEVSARPGLGAASEDYYNRYDVLRASGWEPNKYLATDDAGNLVAVDGMEWEGNGGTAPGISEVLAAIPSAVAITAVKSDDTVTYTTALSDGSQSVSVVTLDSNGCPSRIVTDGVECSVGWEGFDDLALAVWEGGSY